MKAKIEKGDVVYSDYANEIGIVYKVSKFYIDVNWGSLGCGFFSYAKANKYLTLISKADFK